MGPVYSFNQVIETRRQADMDRDLASLDNGWIFATGLLARVRSLGGQRWGVARVG